MYHWVNGARLIVRAGESGLTGNLYCGLHEFEDMAYLLHVLGPDDLFVDIGANAGSYTILACAARGARGYCFEPVPETYGRLMDNVRINNLSERVVALNLGLSDKDGELFFTSGEDCTNHVVRADEVTSDGVRVEVVRLDSILRGQAPSLLKIDVEGYEAAVLNGAHEVLSSPSLHSVIMELNGSGKRYGFSDDEILETMVTYGFSTYAYEPFSRALRNLDGKNHSSGNTLFIRNTQAVREKLRSSPPVTVAGVPL